MKKGYKAILEYLSGFSSELTKENYVRFSAIIVELNKSVLYIKRKKVVKTDNKEKKKICKVCFMSLIKGVSCKMIKLKGDKDYYKVKCRHCGNKCKVKSDW